MDPTERVLERIAALKRRRARRARLLGLAGRVSAVAATLGYLLWSLQRLAPS